MANEIAWLIEWPAHNGNPLRYWAGGDDRSSWSVEANRAIRFCRESDAHRTALSILGFSGISQFRFAEHMWMDAAMVEEARAEALAEQTLCSATAPVAREDGDASK